MRGYNVGWLLGLERGFGDAGPRDVDFARGFGFGAGATPGSAAAAESAAEDEAAAGFGAGAGVDGGGSVSGEPSQRASRVNVSAAGGGAFTSV